MTSAIVKQILDAPLSELQDAVAGAMADARALHRRPRIERKRGEAGVYAQRATYLYWLGMALPDLIKSVLAQEQHARQLLALAKLASPEPMFNNPIVAWEAQRLRDDILRAAGLIGAPSGGE